MACGASAKKSYMHMHTRCGAQRVDAEPAQDRPQSFATVQRSSFGSRSRIVRLGEGWRGIGRADSCMAVVTTSHYAKSEEPRVHSISSSRPSCPCPKQALHLPAVYLRPRCVASVFPRPVDLSAERTLSNTCCPITSKIRWIFTANRGKTEPSKHQKGLLINSTRQQQPKANDANNTDKRAGTVRCSNQK